MLSTPFGTSLNAEPEIKSRRQVQYDNKNELQNDLKAFLAQQANTNPRLRKLRNRDAEANIQPINPSFGRMARNDGLQQGNRLESTRQQSEQYYIEPIREAYRQGSIQQETREYNGNFIGL